jgi:DNA modification methylase/transposase-like protein
VPTGAADAAAQGPLLEAVAETGAIGATVRQVAGRLDTAPALVERRLEALRRDGRLVRLGRGLYVLKDFERLADRDDFIDPAEFTERFVREGGVSLGTYRGPITFSPNDTLPVHRWWPYVQGYSAEFVSGLIRERDLPTGSTVLDPFCGSGTTLVEARRHGMRPVGSEILLPAALAARVKTRFELDPSTLRRGADQLLRNARLRRAGTPPFLRETARQFAPEVVRDLTKLRDALPRGTGPSEEALRLAFGAILIPVSRLRRSPCLGYGRPEPSTPIDVFHTFTEQVDRMVADLGMLRAERTRWGPRATVHPTDARTLDAPEGSVDLAVTSPPYVNGMDYVMNYKLDLAWLGYVHGYAELARLRSTMVACDNLPRRETAGYLATSSTPDPWLPEILDRIRGNVARKGSYRRDDVHGVVHRYFADLVPVLRRVHRALRPGGRLVLVVGDSLMAGTYVPGDLLLARIGARLGFRIVSVDVARQRRSGQRRSFRLRETITTLERPP